MTATVSIVIPTLNSPRIGQVLAAVRGQAMGMGRVEVLVVGCDALGLVVEEAPVRFLKSEQPLTSAQARNRGLLASRGEIVVFLDADCVPERDWLSCLLTPYARRDVSVVGGSMAVESGDWFTVADNVATFHEYLASSPAGVRDLLPSFNLSCRRSALEAVGGFDEAYPYPAGEDADLTTRLRLAGYQLYFEPAAVVRHFPSRNHFRAVLRHAYRFGQYSVKVDPRYASQLAVPWVLRRAWRVWLAAPFMATGITWQAFARDPALRPFWPVAPLMAAAKLAWCAGAARTLSAGAPVRAPWGTIPRLPGLEAGR